MDVGNKTLSQLSQEAKEKRYVALDVGAKVSGYTKEYLERLCRLNKVEFRIWNNGQFVIELDSLLRETHTILLSYEDIVFVEKSELLDPTAQIVGEVLASIAPTREVGTTAEAAAEEAKKILSQKTDEGITQQVPRFGTAGRVGSPRGGEYAFSFTGRAVESDPLNPATANDEPPARIDVVSGDTPIVPEKKTVLPVSSTPVAPPERPATHLTINTEGVSAPMPSKTHLAIAGEDAVATKSKVTVTEEHDEWDSMVLGATPAPVVAATEVSVSAPAVPYRAQMSPLPTPTLHPIQTSVDATEHHDAPLFPLLENAKTSYAQSTSGIVPERGAVHPGIPNLGTNGRVVVFSTAETKRAPEPVARATSLVPPSAILAESPVPTSASAVPMVGAQTPVLASAPERSIERTVTALPQTPQAMSIAKEGEHHLIVREKSSLTKSPAFNVAFVTVLVLTLMTLFGESTLEYVGRPSSNIAGVAGVEESIGISTEDVDSPATESNTRVESLGVQYPFSDDITMATGTEAENITITPVFDTVSGEDVEYTIELTPAGETLYTRE